MRKKETRYYCDKCGKEITDDHIIVFTYFFADRETGDIDMTTQGDESDICFACLDSVDKFIRQKPFQKAQKREFDVGKAQALRDAGWTYKAISEELKCSEQTVWNRLNKKAGDKDAEDET